MNKRRQVSATLMIAAAVMATTVACSSKTTSADAGVDAPADAGSDGVVDAGGADLGSQSCDPYAQNCPTGQKCDFRCLGSSAVVDCQPGTDGGTLGSACSTNNMPCGRGFGCVSSTSFSAMCRNYCATDNDCATGERCHNVTVGVACSGGTTSFALHFCY